MLCKSQYGNKQASSFWVIPFKVILIKRFLLAMGTNQTHNHDGSHAKFRVDRHFHDQPYINLFKFSIHQFSHIKISPSKEVFFLTTTNICLDIQKKGSNSPFFDNSRQHRVLNCEIGQYQPSCYQLHQKCQQCQGHAQTMKACGQLHPDSYGCQSTVSRIKRSSDYIYIYIFLGDYITDSRKV